VGPSQYTDTSARFSARRDPRVADEARQRFERGLNLTIRAERVRLVRQAGDFGQREVLLIAEPEQQALLAGNRAKASLTAVAPVVLRPVAGPWPRLRHPPP